jgi:hypothetical protein
VQVGLQGQDAVEGLAEHPPHHRLAEGLARRKDPVLAHVGQVGRDQVDLRRSGPPQGVRRQKQGHKAAVRPGEAAVKDRRPTGRRRDGGPRLPVREGVGPDEIQRQAKGVGEPSRRAGLVREGVDLGGHARTKPLSSPAASQARAKSDGSSACRR